MVPLAFFFRHLLRNGIVWLCLLVKFDGLCACGTCEIQPM